jgi:hypothetical protein
MTPSLHKALGWFVLAVTLLASPGPASTACACARGMMSDTQLSQSARRECSRCQSAVAPATRTASISRSSCCKAKVSEAHAAATPAKVQLERHESRTAAPASWTPPPAARGTSPRSTRAPPDRNARDSASPPASYLSDYLRL